MRKLSIFINIVIFLIFVNLWLASHMFEVDTISERTTFIWIGACVLVLVLCLLGQRMIHSEKPLEDWHPSKRQK